MNKERPLPDNSERVRIETALRQSNRYQRALLDNFPYAVWLKDTESRFLSVNIGFVRTFGAKSVNDLIGKNDFDIAPRELAEGYRADDRDVMRTRKKKHVEEKIVTGGKITWFETYKAPVIDDNGELLGTVGFARDITERKQAEEEIRKYQEQLQQNQKLESLGVLAGGIAHDFNNLMAGIFGLIDLAKNEPDRDNASGYLVKAMGTIDRARDLTRQLLTFAKGGAPVQKVTPLFPFIRETVQFSLSGSNVSCRFDTPEDLWMCNIDKNQIGQVIDNIIINAQQAMPDGGAIEVTARNVPSVEKAPGSPAGGAYVKISIKDFGIGMPKEILPRIFDPFYTTKPKGHGLGLATCHSIITRHGGRIDVESEPGKGSTFHFYLPASTESPAENTAPAVRHKGRGTIMIVDDEEVVRQTFKVMLGTFGYTVEAMKNGSEALEFFVRETEANRPVTAIFLDLTIPGGMGGKAAAAEIRKLDRIIPVFVASGYADDPVMRNPAAYGFTASISKPFSIDELSEMLNEFLKTRD